MLAYNLGKYFFERIPVLRPILRKGKKIFIKPRFSGWGLTSEHTPAWEGKYEQDFQKTSQDVKKFQFTKDVAIQPKKIDEMLWRHWNICYAVRHAIKFAEIDEYNFVEAGVGDGLSAFFALREIRKHKEIKTFSMHLYDTWGALKKEDLDMTETAKVYSELDINRTQTNLSEFKDELVYHKGYIPESFISTTNPSPPPPPIQFAIYTLT